MHPDYEIRIDKKGHKKLEKVGEHNTYEEIQSFLEETKIENIIARAAAGDLDALNQRQGIYADISEMPTTGMEALNAILKLEQSFEKLDPETRAKFNNSKEEYITSFKTGEWFEKMGLETGAAQKTEDQAFTPEIKTADQVLTPEVKE